MVKSSNKQPDNFKKVKYTYDNKTITFVTHMWCLFAWFTLLIRTIPYRCTNTWGMMRRSNKLVYIAHTNFPLD